MILLNGILQDDDTAVFHASDRGALLADGLFETLRARNGTLAFFSAHFNRLLQSANALDIPLVLTEDELHTQCETLLKANQHENAALRITLTRGAGPRGLLPPAQAKPNLLITSALFYAHKPTATACIVNEIRRNTSSITSKHKTLAYLDNIMAQRIAHEKGFDYAILLNTHGFIASANCANIFFVIDNTLVTPDLQSGILPGIIRAHVLARAKQCGINTMCKSITLQDQKNAQAAFLTNSLAGIMPLVKINNQQYAQHNMIKALQIDFEDEEAEY